MNIPPLSDLQSKIFSSLNAPGAKLSFSQFGEDIIVHSLFRGRPPGFYVDVGAHHPFELSNTAILSNFCGWHGINIDVDDQAIAKFERYRPKDINICVGVGAESCMREVTLFDVGAVNTFDPALADEPKWAPYIREKRMVQVSPLREILDAHIPSGQTVQYLNVDVEGLDYEALVSSNWNKYRPEIVTVEIHNLKLDAVNDDRVCSFMFQNGYRLFSYLFVTAVFMRR